MKRILNYLPFHFLVCVILGIVAQFYTNLWMYGFSKLILVLLVLLLLLWLKSKVLKTIVGLILFFFVGISAVFIQNDLNFDNHYQGHLNNDSSVVLRISKILKPGKFYHKYQAKVVQVNDEQTRGTILLNILIDSNYQSLKVDEKLLLKPRFKELIPPLNPHQFNYKSYLSKQGIHHQVFTENNLFIKLRTTKNTLYGWSAKFRARIQESLQDYHFKNDELSVINALLLGQRQDISKELITNYQSAGAIHILAVSGLHVGIILLILSFVFKPIERIKHGSILKTVLIILLLWMFAFIAGLSASVVRAVTMFSFVAVGMGFRKKKVVEFSFISSMFFLLLLKPMFLFDVGFQLSYLAVFGILWTQPKLYNIYKPNLKIINFFWKLFTVSIAAQIGILPLSIYYFKQFPGLFMLSNLIIIPFLGAILIGGIFVIIASLLSILPQLLADFYANSIALMNSFVSWVSHQEAFLFKELHLSLLLMIVSYVSIFLGVWFFDKISTKRLTYFLCSIVVLQIVFLLENNKLEKKKELIVFHKSRYSILANRNGNQLMIQHDLDDDKLQSENSITSYRVSENIKSIKTTNFANVLKYNQKHILRVDSLGVYQISELKSPIVILQYSPKINLERLIKTLSPAKIIADGSNYKSYINRWEKTCLEKQIPFHYTGQQGAFILQD